MKNSNLSLDTPSEMDSTQITKSQAGKPGALSALIRPLIRDVPNFPKTGVMFRDITPLLQSAEAMESVLEAFGTALKIDEIEAFVGIESRGFILASMLATKYRKGFVPLRKAGKLPPPTHQQSYNLEYGQATLEIAPGQGRVVVIDDVLATGGTLQAGIDLCRKAGYVVSGAAVLIDLQFLNQFRFDGRPVASILQYT
mgnify:CR=1 FL=1